ncbi:chloride channel protein [Streptomyces sp. NPDC047014]|uniref:chloride channel protein n=1 Tax=Streptomyces sp. NPDC047014 TaxID=3155736 RepID=UPI0033D884CA
MPQTRPGPEPSAEPSAGQEQPQEATVLRQLLRSPGYLKLLCLSALIGIPVSLAAFWFLVAIRQMETSLWTDLPKSLGWDAPPWWWPLPLLLVGGVVVGLVVTHMRGAGGHIPAGGMQTGGASAGALPGVVLAAAASLPLGAVLGPEAPLIALGGGLALLLRDIAQAPATPQSTVLVGAAGAGAAIAVIFGSPLIAAVLLIEVAGVGGPQLFAVMLPALLSTGVGSLVFTGLGRWTGLPTGDLTLKLSGPAPHLDAADVGWAVLIGAAVALALHPVMHGARLIARYVVARPLVRTVQCALAAAVCIALFALITGRSPADAAGSGQQTLAELTKDPHAWSVGALIAVLLFKGAAYALCLGSMRGGPIFPALCLGGMAGVLLAPLPGLGLIPALAACMAATAASAMRLPVSSVVLVVVVLGGAAMVPVVILAAVVAFVVTELLPAGPTVPSLSGPHGAPGAPGTPGAPAAPAARP